MTFSLLTEPWIPVRRRDGASGWIAPPGIAATEANPVVAITWPRPDFRLAALEFLIGLLATACPPTSHYAWLRTYNNPPSADSLARAFAPLAEAFQLDGDGPRFLQDLEDFVEDPIPIGQLLIEAPGKATIDKNTDLIVHRGQISTLSRKAAAMALFTLQTYAPSGGAGNRTSLRGGGPLTSLALPPGGDQLPLWHSLWANVPTRDAPIDPGQDLKRIFPWLAPTRLSDKTGRSTTPADVDALQAFWGMPRRIRLNFADLAACCDITGDTDIVMVSSWRQRPWGTNYTVWGGAHPLSPCYRMKPDAEWLPLHPQPGGIGYQHWQGLLSLKPGETRQIAPIILEFRRNRIPDLDAGPTPWRLFAGGYDMDNMKARGFVESEMPVYEPSDPGRAEATDEVIVALVTAADIVAGLLVRCVRRAWFSEGAEIKTQDVAAFAALRERFWADTAHEFFDRVRFLAGGGEEAAVKRGWLRDLSAKARALFAEAAPMDSSGAGHPERIAGAARELGAALTGYGKAGEAVFGALGLNLPEGANAKRRKKGEQQ